MLILQPLVSSFITKCHSIFNKAYSMQTQIEQKLTELFKQWCGKTPAYIYHIPPSASYRRYYRLVADQYTALGAYNADLSENRAFIELSKHFFSKGLPVPQLYAVSDDFSVYLQEDLGDMTLFDFTYQYRQLHHPFTDDMLRAYQLSLDALVRLQIDGSEGLDYSVCYPSAMFDKQSMMWDCNYFKYNFLKLLQIDVDQHALEVDFNRLTEFLIQADSDFFMHRDFQARNIMLLNGQPYFIDYQGGRKGPLQYDLASLLYQARANLTEEIREDLFQYYLDKVAQRLHNLDIKAFKVQFDGFVLMRCLQLLGAYGFRGLFERKAHFIDSIPLALQNLSESAQKVNRFLPLPGIIAAIEQVQYSGKWKPIDRQENAKAPLTVLIQSFSYRKGMPTFEGEHGGGFVFDCRALHNPGRYEEYKHQNGLDKPVADFLKAQSKAEEWLSYVFALVDRSIEDYLKRDFETLSVAFGCTGGQHRSVFCAEQLANHVAEKFGVKFSIVHNERGKWGSSG